MTCPVCECKERPIHPVSGKTYICGTWTNDDGSIRGEPSEECLSACAASVEEAVGEAVRRMSRLSFVKRNMVRCESCNGLGLIEEGS